MRHFSDANRLRFVWGSRDNSLVDWITRNRKLYKGNHIRKKASRILFGFRQWDKVRHNGRKYFIKGRRTSGYFSLSDILGKGATPDGKKLDSVRYTHLSLVEEASTLLGRREWLSSPLTERGIQPQL